VRIAVSEARRGEAVSTTVTQTTTTRREPDVEERKVVPVKWWARLPTRALRDEHWALAERKI
jgi:hypothetical protein